MIRKCEVCFEEGQVVVNEEDGCKQYDYCPKCEGMGQYEIDENVWLQEVKSKIEKHNGEISYRGGTERESELLLLSYELYKFAISKVDKKV